MKNKHQNPDGTYNGVTFFAEVTGLSQAEIKWMFDRAKHLKQVEGLSKEEIKKRLTEEGRTRPWELSRGA